MASLVEAGVPPALQEKPAARVRPDLAHQVRFESSQQIRDEIARAVPLYAGIERLGKKGDQMQWGGRHLYAEGVFGTADGKAHFSAVTPPSRRPEPGRYFVSTRRGKQFNSMIQHDKDPLTGARREDVLMSAEDAHQRAGARIWAERSRAALDAL